MKKSLFLIISLILLSFLAFGQIPYGNNPEAGKYFDAGGVKLYYEIYGQGEPILLLHGGVYSYIDEFENLIPKLAENHQVICLATRGHGKSEVGHEPYTYKQRAEDAYKMIRHLKLDSVIVLGFSDGGATALKLAALYPEVTRKVIAMGVGDVPEGSRKNKYNYSAEDLLTQNKDYFESRLKLMPEPDRWNESLQMLNGLYNSDYVSAETFEKIKCPVLLMNGEQDNYHTVDNLIRCYKAISNVDLSIIPGCHHVIFYCNFPAVWESMKSFL